MATSLRDLLEAADAEFRGDQVGLGEAAAALGRTARLLDLMLAYRSDAKHSQARRDRIRSLARPCERAAGAWPNEPGRASELLGVAADAVGVFRDQLTADDRWALTLRTASIARRAALVISAAGPYAKAPTLRLTIAAADELRRMGANNPPNPERFRSIDSPIPLAMASEQATLHGAATEFMARLVYEFISPENPPFAMSELIAAVRAGEAVAGALAEDASAGAPEISSLGAWTQLRERLTCFTDGHSRLGSDGRVFETAVGLCRAVDRPAAPGKEAELRLAAPRITELLQALAVGIEVQWLRMNRQLFVVPGFAPFSEARMGEWLRRRTFMAGPAERAVVNDSLRSVTSSPGVVFGAPLDAASAQTSLRRHGNVASPLALPPL